MKVVLTIAGSDSFAGAGIQADLKTFAALGVYGTSVVTAVTSQNSSQIDDVLALPADVVRRQIGSVFRDTSLSAVKIGMLATPEIVKAVASAVQESKLPNVVVDPVMVATGAGSRTLLEPEAVSILRRELLPLATVVTPNVSEAEALAGIRVTSLEMAKEAAKRIRDLGVGAVVVKGGHLPDPMATDVLYDGQAMMEFSSPRRLITTIHGTGCTFASAITAGLAMGDDVPAAVRRAKRYITGAIAHALQVGRGALVLDHFWETRGSASVDVRERP
jgi:hydroxymethylpyrimidine/phosphomethylpyrimidine kinase